MAQRPEGKSMAGLWGISGWKNRNRWSPWICPNARTGKSRLKLALVACFQLKVCFAQLSRFSPDYASFCHSRLARRAFISKAKPWNGCLFRSYTPFPCLRQTSPWFLAESNLKMFILNWCIVRFMTWKIFTTTQVVTWCAVLFKIIWDLGGIMSRSKSRWHWLCPTLFGNVSDKAERVIRFLLQGRVRIIGLILKKIWGFGRRIRTSDWNKFCWSCFTHSFFGTCRAFTFEFVRNLAHFEK